MISALTTRSRSVLSQTRIVLFLVLARLKSSLLRRKSRDQLNPSLNPRLKLQMDVG